MPLKVKGYTISDDLFTRGYPAGGGPCTCTSKCCFGGVWADLRERDRILEHREEIKRFMDETQNTDPASWFDSEILDDQDFPSGKCIGTTEINDKCAFLDKQGRCAIQMNSVSKGLHKWEMKPFFCILFPIEVTNGVIGFDDMLQDEQSCCTIGSDFSLPLFRGCKEELIFVLGEDGYAALEDHYATLTKEKH